MSGATETWCCGDASLARLPSNTDRASFSGVSHLILQIDRMSFLRSML